MLTSLEIKDYALIENIHVEFENGLNIITGETGAGKSILIGALGLLLGERASTETVRKGSQKSIIEGFFEVGKNKKVLQLLDENNIDVNEELIVRREISTKGSNRCFINDTPVQLSMIKQIGNLLIDLHGQHDHQSLLREETHIDFLDEFCQIEKDLEKYTQLKNELFSITKEIKSLKQNEKSIKEKSELNQFQLKEISAVDPQKNEDEVLDRELNILENSERLFSESNQIYEAIYESENSAYDLITTIKNNIVDISRIDELVKEKLVDINSALELLREVGDYFRDYKDKLEIDPERIDEVRDRVGAIYMLKKKYGGSLERVLEYKNKIEEELNISGNFSEKIEELNKKANKKREEVKSVAFLLSEKRKKKAKLIEKEIIKTLSFLGINDSTFEIKFSFEKDDSTENFILVGKDKIALNTKGIDNIEFYISTNLGEDLKPLSKTASGGEISRVMLAIKSVLAKTEKLPLLIFDEIDTGVSGRIAQKVGEVLKDLSKTHQIISITHLPQIAAFANHHYSVQKQKSNSRVVSSIIKLEQKDQVEEIAKLISGEEISDAALESAKQLMKY